MDQMPPAAPQPPVPSQYPDSSAVPPEPRKVGLAIAALVLAICGVIPCIGIPLALTGLILGIVALAGKTTARGLAIAGIVIGGIFLTLLPLAASIMLPSLNHARELAKQTVCMSSLKQLHLGAMMYCDANNDAYPPDIDQSLADYMGEDASTVDRLTCPNAQDAPDRGYFYLAPACSRNEIAQIGDPSEIIIACDWADNHPIRRSVLFADGRVAAMGEDEFADALAQPQNAAFAAALREAEAQRDMGFEEN